MRTRDTFSLIFHLILPLLFMSPGSVLAQPQPVFTIKDTGTEFPVQYEKYGTFSARGTGEYKYKITDREGLARAMGSGLYPNGTSLSQDPGYKAWRAKKDTSSHWDHVQTGDPRTDFYVWASARDVGPGTKLYFIAQALAEAGLYQHAVKAYHAVIVHFPREVCWSADHSFFWYVADAALDQIESLTQHHAEIGYMLKGAVFKVTNGNDTNKDNDIFVIDPGQWVKRGDAKATDLKSLKITNQRGYGRVHLVQFENKHWQLRVRGEPFVVRAVSYLPTPVGQHISEWKNQWMFEDADESGQPDAVYETWLDKNKNGKQDKDDPVMGDFELLRQMGANAVRIVRLSQDLEYNGREFNKEVLRDMHQRYGIYAIMQDYVGAYALGSGATWEEGTDYNDPVQIENMKRLLRSYVMDHRNEPYVLMWVLGNENLMPADYSGVNATRTNAAGNVAAYLRFIDELAQMIHTIDPDHPVAVGNLGTVQLEQYAKLAPNVDIFGVNSYPGAKGFGKMWRQVSEVYDRPVFITEYGCDSYDTRKEQEDEAAQAAYHEGNWRDIELHLSGGPAEGNAVGGMVFEWMDEWWKSQHGSPKKHDAGKDTSAAFFDGWANEEWYGLFAQGDGSQSPLIRQPRKVYLLYRDKLWKPYRPAE